ncbi:MAG: GTPase HflX [Verrucomicrobiota bacterium]
MFEIKEKPKMVERALLVGVYENRDEESQTSSLINELEELVGTLGVPVFAKELVRVRKFNAKLLMGQGKADEILGIVRALDLDVIVFDNELSPAQQRNWERSAKVCVIDRQEVILDIFGKRAQTKEARLQIDLARMIYSLPRLTRAWSHFGQQGGGIGTRGEGETQLELDRRIVRKQIDRLKSELAQVRKQRQTQRQQRVRVPVPHAAIVGYTNAGKSSLLKRLTQADVLVEDKLFATLDTTTRKIELPNKQRLLLTDTVGFVRKLPHLLVEAFKATLEEALTANFLIHVIDANQDDVFAIHRTTMEVLKELGADEKETITLFNKVDLVKDANQLRELKIHFPDAHFISVHSGQGLDTFQDELADLLSRSTRTMELQIPHSRSDILAKLHRESNVIKVDYDDTAIHAVAVVPYRITGHFEAYESTPSGDLSELSAQVISKKS